MRCWRHCHPAAPYLWHHSHYVRLQLHFEPRIDLQQFRVSLVNMKGRLNRAVKDFCGQSPRGEHDRDSNVPSSSSKSEYPTSSSL